MSRARSVANDKIKIVSSTTAVETTILQMSDGSNSLGSIRTYNNGGYNQSLRIYTTSTAGSSEIKTLEIDGYGRMTNQYQPSFRVGMNGSPTTTNGTTLLWDLISHNTGNHYSSSTGRFTAPVTGKYFISHGIRFNANGSAYTQSTLAINGVNAPSGLYANATVTGATYSTPQWSGILNLNAGDYLTISGAFSGGTGVYSGAESWFSGHLVG